jgi:predicted DNA-binding transcriptional regulator AlpA
MSSNTTIFLTDKQLAERWHMHRQTLIRWRTKGTGPKFFKINNQVRYKLSDVEAFEESTIVNPE